MAAPTLNGVTFYPSDIAPDHEKIGHEIQAADGSRRWAHRADKRTWKIEWKSVPLATLTAVRAIFNLTTTFTFVDENGDAATVFCKAGALSSSVAEIGQNSGGQVLLYNVSLTLTEA